MTTFYRYEKDGTVTASSIDPAAQTLECGTSDPGCAYEERGDFAGAFLARRDTTYRSSPAFFASQVQVTPYTSYDMQHRQPVDQPSVHYEISEAIHQGPYPKNGHGPSDYADSFYSESSANTLGYAGWASQYGLSHPYPNPEHIRNQHTLRSLLPNLQPERKLNALSGPVVDIVEESTGFQLASRVPKKLLVLFLGRQMVNKFIRTLHRQGDQNWRGKPTVQEIHLPQGITSKAAVQVLIAWMVRACQHHTMGTMEQIHIPENLFVACSLAETMEILGLHKDALRVDRYIAQTHFVRPIFAVELGSLWNCLSEHSRYVYAVIKIVAKRLQKYEQDGAKAFKGIDHNMITLLEENPRLEARVRDLALNEKYRPVFGTDWFKNLGNNAKEQKGHGLGLGAGSRGSSGKKYRDDWAATLLDQKPQPVSHVNGDRMFSTLRIVPESTKHSSGCDPASTEN